MVPDPVAVIEPVEFPQVVFVWDIAIAGPGNMNVTEACVPEQARLMVAVTV